MKTALFVRVIRFIKWVFAMMAAPGVVIFSNGANAQDKTAQAKQSQVVFFDDFSAPQLDRTKWNVIVSGRTVNNEQQAYVDSAETLSIVHGEEAEGAENGALLIRAVYKPGFTTAQNRKYDFISGRLDTRGKFEFTYGTAAARMKLPAGAGFWPAFWALGNGRWPATGEIDIMEYVGETDWISAALHGPGYFGNTPLIKKATLARDKDAAAWHIYSVDWTPDTLTFKVDDHAYYEVTKPMIEKYGPWAYDNPKHLILNFALGGAYPIKVNHARLPYPGIPEATVQLIKDGKAKVLVDWVRVTKNNSQ
jgi:beta-glucanase (GH16 family)